MGAARLQALFSQDAPQAASWVRAVALDGLPSAQLCYGRMLLEGTGVRKDPQAALKWFYRAAEGGDVDALNMVGRCFDNGWGTSEDAARAATCFHGAAQAGHAWARYNLAHLYLNGRVYAEMRPRPMGTICWRGSRGTSAR